MNDFCSFSNISRVNPGSSIRISSYDRSGGNKDFYTVEPGTRIELCDLHGSGCVRHIWMTMASACGDEEVFLPRKIILRMFWDDEDFPSVEVPIGDFFGMGHGITRNFSSVFLAMSPQDGKAFNCFFPMPYERRARIEIESQANGPIKLYFYIDCHRLPSVGEDQLRFHAQWNRQCSTDGIDERIMSNAEFEFGGKNTTGEGNYVILDAVGSGHYVGCNFNVHNLRMTREWNWYGEGDDMIFIDDEPWPPSLHGTGTEDYFNTAWCPTQEYNSPFHGLILGGGPNWSGKVSFYRYHILDPVLFSRSIRVTIEHGHNNQRSDDLSSTAYWYQYEPHKALPAIIGVDSRLPLPEILPFNEESLRKLI